MIANPAKYKKLQSQKRKRVRHKSSFKLFFIKNATKQISPAPLNGYFAYRKLAPAKQ